MLIRRCAQGHDIKVYRNTTPGATRTKSYPDGTTETLTYPSSYKYFLVIDGEIERRSNSWETIEELYVSKCEDKHTTSNGRVIIGKHKLVNHIITKLGS
jgi:hypothetical protein|tara:strand:+ start:1753 stop:2049 length:297 start_codon:yes stop_codon:yes gene_type:complete